MVNRLIEIGCLAEKLIRLGCEVGQLSDSNSDLTGAHHSKRHLYCKFLFVLIKLKQVKDTSSKERNQRGEPKKFPTRRTQKKFNFKRQVLTSTTDKEDK